MANVSKNNGDRKYMENPARNGYSLLRGARVFSHTLFWPLSVKTSFTRLCGTVSRSVGVYKFLALSCSLRMEPPVGECCLQNRRICYRNITRPLAICWYFLWVNGLRGAGPNRHFETMDFSRFGVSSSVFGPNNDDFSRDAHDTVLEICGGG